MIKKFVSNALLSVVMDKSARAKLKGMHGDTPSARSPAPKTAELGHDAAAAAEDLAQTIEMALADARVEAAGKPERIAGGGNAPARPAARKQPAKPMTPDREQLIRNAISIHREKAKILDDLEPEAREKLTVMALMALDPDSLPGGKSEKSGSSGAGPVDEISGARNRPKNRFKKRS